MLIDQPAAWSDTAAEKKPSKSGTNGAKCGANPHNSATITE
jgi:hypothetical protein